MVGPSSQHERYRVMPNNRRSDFALPHLKAVEVTALLAIALLTSSCATPPTDRTVAAERPAPQCSPAPIPVLRYGRYTLAELTPAPAQADLMQQIVEITLPPTMNATVGEALRYVLLKTGYQLCDHSDAGPLLDALPLPAADLHLGPMRLREALQVLIGSAWSVKVDDSTRRVCFERSVPPSTKSAS